jgi:heme/copper-type cytochrome/quinol oxidase subunit 1
MTKPRATKAANVYVEPPPKQREPFQWTPWKLVTVIGGVAAALAIFPAWWTFANHWMNRAEVEDTAAKLAKQTKDAQDKMEQELTEHKAHDANVQSWNQYGFASNRVEYLADKQAECEAKQMTTPKLPPYDVAMCARYQQQMKLKTDEALSLKAKAMDAGKEKP